MPPLPELVQALLDPEAYPHLPQTQMSFVFLVDDYVYKVKKPVNLGYLDYTTLDKRAHNQAPGPYFDRRAGQSDRVCRENASPPSGSDAECPAGQ